LILLPGQAINNVKAVVPWKELLSRSEEYVGAKYLPADFTLMDPSHIHAEDVIRLLDHWYARQAKMKPLLRFHQVVPPGQAVSSGPFHPNPRIAKNTSSEDDTDDSPQRAFSFNASAGPAWTSNGIKKSCRAWTVIAKPAG
jgi:hypothetical protein